MSTLLTPISALTEASLSKSMIVEDPTNAEDLTMFFTNIAITVVAVNAVLIGSTPTVTCRIMHDTDRNASGNAVFATSRTVSSTTTGPALTLGGDITIPANSWVWLETSATSGTVSEMSVTLRYTQD